MNESALSDVVASMWTLAKEIGKGGGGSTEEPTVCSTLLPVGVGLLLLGAASLRRRLARNSVVSPRL